MEITGAILIGFADRISEMSFAKRCSTVATCSWLRQGDPNGAPRRIDGVLTLA